MTPLSAGVFLALGIMCAALLVGHYTQISTTLLAIFIGIALSPLSRKPFLKPGVDFAATTVLRTGIGLLGFNILTSDFVTLGWQAIVMIAMAIGAVIGFGAIGARLLGMRRDLGILSGGAIAICGGAAALAISSIQPDHKDKERDLGVVIIALTLFSTLEMITLPLLAPHLALGTTELGILAGSIVHDVAQTAGAGYSISDEVGAMAVLTKMIRVSFILPIALMLIWFYNAQHDNSTGDSAGAGKVKVPFFLIAFFVCIGLNSFLPIPSAALDGIAAVSKYTLITAMAAIGLRTNFASILSIGAKPLILIAMQVMLLVSIVLAYVMSL